MSTTTQRTAPEPPSAPTDDASEAIAEAVREATATVAGLADRRNAALADADRAKAILADAMASVALGHDAGLAAAQAEADKAAATLAQLEREHERATAMTERLRTRHREARRRELLAEQDGLAVEWQATLDRLGGLLPDWSESWRELWRLRERDHALRQQSVALDSPDDAPHVLGTHGLRLVPVHDQEQPLPESAIEQARQALDNLRLRDEPPM